MCSRLASPGFWNSSPMRCDRSINARAALLVLSSPSSSQLQRARSRPGHKTASTPPPELSRFDLYGGYGYLHPVNSDIGNIQYQPINPGAVASAQVTLTVSSVSRPKAASSPTVPTTASTPHRPAPSSAIRRTLRSLRPCPRRRSQGLAAPSSSPAPGAGASPSGIGLDYILPASTTASRSGPFKPTFNYSHVDYGTPGPGLVTGRRRATSTPTVSRRASSLRLGQITPPPPVQLGCTVQPANIFPGDPVTVTATASNLDLKKKATYTWSVSGGHITGTDSTATVTTAGLAPGDYTVSGHVSEGMRPGQQASCTAGSASTLNEPPTDQLLGNPSTVMPDPSTITSVANSPQNRPLSYSYSALRPDRQQHIHRNPQHCRRLSRHHQRHLPTSSTTWANRPPPTLRSPSRLLHPRPRRRYAISAASPSSATESVRTRRQRSQGLPR